MKEITTSKHLDFFSADTSSDQPLPFFSDGIKAGFPSPAEDFDGASIDLNQELVTNASATFFARVKGASMSEEGIENGDILVIDKSLEPKTGKVAVCFIDGEFTVKRIKIEKDIIWLMPANSDYKPIKVTPDNDFMVWGIVTYVIKNVG